MSMPAAHLAVPAWHDRKRAWWTLGALMPLLPFVGAALAAATGNAVFWWLTPIWFFGVLPLLDSLVGEDTDNPPESAVEHLEGSRWYRACLYAYLLAHYAVVVAGAWLFARGDLTLAGTLGLTVSVGLIGGGAINVAHELGHKRERLDRWLARIALAPVAYGHFYVEHNRGHHVRVATADDPATSRLGESLYAFLPRTLLGSLRSAWRLERERLQREARGVWNWRNDNLRGWAMSLALFAVLTAWLGAAVLPFLLAQAAIGFCLLELVNYIEHYGLLRAKDANGRHERCQPRHSWNSNHLVSNLMLYHLQRHSDHHAHPTRSYPCLRHWADAPQLPSGYPGMMLLALLPPLWRAVMDPRVQRHRARHDGSVQPS